MDKTRKSFFSKLRTKGDEYNLSSRNEGCRDTTLEELLGPLPQVQNAAKRAPNLVVPLGKPHSALQMGSVSFTNVAYSSIWNDKVDNNAFQGRSSEEINIVDDSPSKNNGLGGGGDESKLINVPHQIDCSPSPRSRFAMHSGVLNNANPAPSDRSRRLSNLSNRFRKSIDHEVSISPINCGSTSSVLGSRDNASNTRTTSNQKQLTAASLVVRKTPFNNTKGIGIGGTETNFKTPDKRRAVVNQAVSDSDEECSLESTIVVEDSPIKVVDRCKRKRPPLTYATKKFIRQSNDVSSFSSLSDRNIFEDSSQSSASPVITTPMALWVHQDQGDTHDIGNIIQFESPSKLPATEKNPCRSRKPKSILEAFKSIKSRYDSSVHLFGHELRCGKYDEDTSLHLLIRKVVEREERLVKTIAYDLNANVNRWIVFRPTDPCEILEGLCMKLYLPWQEVVITGTTESIIIAADFYKILRNADATLTESRKKEINGLPMPTFGPTSVPGTFFMDRVPYQIKNKRTVLRQTRCFRSYIDVEALVLNIWKQTTPVMVLIKDSDNFISLLEVPASADDLLPMLQPGRFLKLEQLAVANRITPSTKLALFSILRFYDSNQTYYYVLRWGSESIWEIETLLDIPMVKSHSEWLTVPEIHMAANHKDRDYRVSLKCRVKRATADSITVSDESERTLNIEIVLDSSLSIQDVTLRRYETILLKFLRLIHGKAIWDQFTTVMQRKDN